MTEAILITGASSGLGFEMAKWYANHHPERVLVIAGRSKDGLEACRKACQSLGAQSVIPFIVDLANASEREQLVRDLHAQGLCIGALINNAGGNDAGLYRCLQPEQVSQILAINLEACIHLFALLRTDLYQSSGRVLQISSTGAYQPGPYTAVYYAAKSFVQSFFEAMMIEEPGIHFCIARPGALATPFSKRAGKVMVNGSMSPDQAADIILKAFEHKKRSVTPGLMNKIVIALSKILPRRLLGKLVARIQAPLQMKKSSSPESAPFEAEQT